MAAAKSLMLYLLLFLIEITTNAELTSSLDNLKISKLFTSSIYQINRHERGKRDAQRPQPLADLQKKLSAEKLKKEDVVATDANLRLEPNYTGMPRPSEDPQFGGINNEQIYHRKNDKVHQLYTIHKSDKDSNYVSPGVECNFESACSWKWKDDGTNGFFVTSPSSYGSNETGPVKDGDGNEEGHFLLLRLKPTTKEVHVTSPLFNLSGDSCRIQFWLYLEEMQQGMVRIVGVTKNQTQVIVDEIHGSHSINNRSWTKYEKTIGKKNEEFNILLEVVSSPLISRKANVAFDNIKLLQCFPENDHMNTCTPHQYRCSSNNICINNTKVCDITEDCEYGEDENQNCDKMPLGARCTFEENWCGWSNTGEKNLQWARHSGPTPTNKTGPNVDHTYKNATGHYMFVNMAVDAVFAEGATLKSATFNPPPRVHGNASSSYYNSCTIRFYLHQFGTHKSGIMLRVTELRPTEQVQTEIFWSYSDLGDTWVRKVVILPNITHRYYLHFDARRGIRYLGDVAIDDFSLSPECFGLNIPAVELKGYNYWNPFPELAANNESHADFANETYYEVTTCNAKGIYGPTQEDCTAAYSKTKLKVKVMHEPGLSGVQKWVVPSEGYYTFILVGASGGKGGGAMGSSRGAMVRTVIELKKGQEIYLAVGQEGTSACVKSLGQTSNSSCKSLRNDNSGNLTGIRGILNMEVIDGGGGGGGASYLFLRNRTATIPIAIASGGGGIGLGRFIDGGLQHGQAINLSRPAVTGHMYGVNTTAGAGGGWRMSKSELEDYHKARMGQPLMLGGQGGRACYNSTDDRGDGGFGGGGGGCKDGGGGGGYAGGNAWTTNTTNGEGGYSFLDPTRTVATLSEARSKYHAGPGSILIIPAVPGCGCDYRCIALDARRSKVTCICPKNWELDANGKSCDLVDKTASTIDEDWYIGGMVFIAVAATVVITLVCFVLYNRYQKRAAGVLRRKMLNGPDFQLNRLRVASDNMMTEYNPNYEFGGVVYTLRDLKDIPRDQLRLVKALGQGAFGEVYQGFYRQRSGDTIEMPVAVKTLPEMSTNQAEMDFLMEALIMSKFKHPNIVHFIGVCFNKHPRFIVLELLAGGDLKNFLRESRPKPDRSSPITMKDLIMIAIDVAKGCKYMEENRFIHRDIAARNCLLTTKGPGRVVKIADFGMSRDIYRSDYYRKGGKAMLPIKWMPPEAFLDGIFTSKTDVWSFGVLLWEIMSMGYMPYTGCSNREVMQLVTNGGRLEPPASCPGPIYGIMTQCWHPTPDQRPTFRLLLERLDYCIQDPEVISAPLPVFNRPPSQERDTTIMRPNDSNESCLQVPQTADYLIPNHTVLSTTQNIGSSSSVDKLIPDNSENWETTFVMPHSKSTQPLLQENDINADENSGSSDQLVTVNNTQNISNHQVSPISLPNNVLSNHNNNSKTDASNLKAGVSLDAGVLAKQNMAVAQKKSYANINNVKDCATGNSAVKNGPFSLPTQNNFLNNSGSNKFINESEISC